MLTMFIQGTLRYFYKTKSTQSSKEAGELFAFAAVALPFIDAVDSNAATLLYNRAFNLDFSGDAAAPSIEAVSKARRWFRYRSHYVRRCRYFV